MNKRTRIWTNIGKAKALMLRYLMIENGKTVAEVAACTGIEVTSLRAFLHLEARLTAEEAEALALHFRMKPSAFVV